MLNFQPLNTPAVRAVQSGSLDANGRPPEVAICTEHGYPCRHCLEHIKKGEPYLTLSWRPFSTLQPYAETGPIFLHAESCPAYADSARLPSIFSSGTYLIRAYNREQRILYGTGKVIATDNIEEEAERLFQDDSVSFIDLRSASNNCFHCRVRRGN